MSEGKVSTKLYYGTYHGHEPELLGHVATSLRAHGGGAPRRIIWLAGDSSLDNKYWLQPTTVPAANGMEVLLSPPRSLPDIAHQINVLLAAEAPLFACVNASVEEGTLQGRGAALAAGAPYPPCTEQDALLRNSVEAGDVVVASAGGNDVVLKPSPATVVAMAAVLALGTDAGIDAGASWGMGTLVALFKGQMEAYLGALTARTKPALALACFPYFPCVTGRGWADTTLAMMGYTNSPGRLQRVMRAAFRLATQQLRVSGVHVVPIALFDALDPSAEGDYVARVEPSAAGGAKIARLIVDAVVRELQPAGARKRAESGGGGGGSGAGRR